MLIKTTFLITVPPLYSDSSMTGTYCLI